MAVSPNIDKINALIANASGSGGSERGNYQKFITELCDGLGVPSPDYTKENIAANDYVYERSIRFNLPDGSVTPGYIDCYKRGHFILEAKQSKKRQKQREKQEKPTQQLSLINLPHSEKDKPKKRDGWDNIMMAAKEQAVGYARALPVDHGYPPFLLIVDVGHVIEVYADFSGQGKNYAHFPDRQNFRIAR